jgi:hypothetical protein
MLVFTNYIYIINYYLQLLTIVTTINNTAIIKKYLSLQTVRQLKISLIITNNDHKYKQYLQLFITSYK